MKLPLIFCVVCALAPYLADAQQSTSTTTTTTTTYVPTSTVVGARVMGSQGDEVGQISDVVLDKQSGCMAYVVLATDQGGTRKMVAAPWGIFNAGTDNRTYTVSVDRQKIYSAPAWESSRISEYSRADWIGNVYSYYGVQPQAGLNIQTNVGVNTERRDDTNVNTRVRQSERTQDRTRGNMEERNTSQRNADLLTQPSPGGHNQSAESDMDKTRADQQAQRQERRDRRQQRAERRSTDTGSMRDDNANASNGEREQQDQRAERRSDNNGSMQDQSSNAMDDRTQHRSEGQSQRANTSPSSQSPESAREQRTQSGDTEHPGHDMQSSSQRPEASAHQHGTSAEARAQSRSHQDQQGQHPAAQASPTP